jgi:uncharacterized protein YndB with AHSA1/START domain
MTNIVLAAVAAGFIGGLWGGTVHQAAAAEDAVSARGKERAARRASARAADFHANGANDKVGVEFIFDALVSNGDRAGGVFHVEFDSEVEKPARLVYQWTMTTDRGELVGEAASRVEELPGLGVLAAEGWRLPGVLGGFYKVSLVAAVATSDRSYVNVLTKDWHLKATRGVLDEISAEEWYAESQARYAFSEGGQP